MSRGFLLFVSYNKQLDYIKLAEICAYYIKKNLKYNHISIVVDNAAYKVLDSKTKNIFDNIIIQDNIPHNNSRNINNKNIPFNNLSRTDAYNVSPYNETIILDTDYLVLSNFLDSIWDNTEDFLINKTATDACLQKYEGNDRELSPEGIPMYWATLIYFKKTKNNKILFDLTKFIQENYLFYKFLYKFPGFTYRNDYVFSIAVHILNGFIEKNINLGNKYITTKIQDEIIQMSDNNIILLINDTKHKWKYTLTNISKIDIHVLNKDSIIKSYNKKVKNDNKK